MGECLPPASDELLDRYAAVLHTLGAAHGITGLRHGRPGWLVGDVAPGRTLMDMARFELEAESLLGAGVALMASSAPAAAGMAGAPLRVTSAA